jgi:hypothetical protein
LRLSVNRFASVFQPGEEEEVSKILACLRSKSPVRARKSSTPPVHHSERDLSLPPPLRSIPRALRRETIVVGFMPSKVAASVGPKIFPPVCFRAAIEFGALALEYGSGGVRINAVAALDSYTTI